MLCSTAHSMMTFTGCFFLIAPCRMLNLFLNLHKHLPTIAHVVKLWSIERNSLFFIFQGKDVLDYTHVCDNNKGSSCRCRYKTLHMIVIRFVRMQHNAIVSQGPIIIKNIHFKSNMDFAHWPRINLKQQIMTNQNIVYLSICPCN